MILEEGRKNNFFCYSFSAINDFDLYIFKFTDYGKDFPKQHNMSPDSFIQMCLQFSYFKFVIFQKENVFHRLLF